MKKKHQSGNTLGANKLLGQNFLTSDVITQEIISASGVKPGDTVLEIGPGKGILTRALLDAGVHVIAVEKDIRFVELLGEELGTHKNLRIINDDILNVDRTQLGLRNESFFVVANIPYYITAKITRMFLETEPRPRSMTLMVQYEVAKRITSKPPEMNLLALSIQAYGRPRVVKKVSKKYFRPQPKVDSAILTISDINDSFFQKHNLSSDVFFARAKKAFAQKRKMLRNSLGIESKKRPQELSLEDWASLAF